MIKHSPAEQYLKYLVTHPSCYDNQYIKDVARELSLDILGDWYLTWLRARVRPPVPFFPEDKTHVKSQRFLLDEKLEQAFLPDRDMQLALRLVYKPRPREIAETMILSGAPNGAVSLALSSRHNLRITERAIKLFKHYFWDIELLSSVEMRALLDLRNQNLLNSTDKEVQAQHAALHRARHNDPRVLAAKMPRSAVMGLVAQMNAGVMPKRLDTAKLVQEAFTQCLAKVVDSYAAGGPQGAQVTQSYIQSAEVLLRLKEAVTNPEEKLREDLARINIASTPNRVPTINQLTQGNSTKDLQPEPVGQGVIDVEAEDVDDDD